MKYDVVIILASLGYRCFIFSFLDPVTGTEIKKYVQNVIETQTAHYIICLQAKNVTSGLNEFHEPIMQEYYLKYRQSYANMHEV